METTTALTTTIDMERKVDNLLLLQKITLKDIEGFNNEERIYFSKAATAILAELHGADKTSFLEKIDAVVSVETRNETWDYNHTIISNAITDHTRRHGAMPTKSKIAEITGFSRQTIGKHLKEYQEHSEFADATEQFKFMSQRVLAGVFKYATNGDMRAARLYFEMTGGLNKRQNSTIVNAQNNFIQINNTILSQENLKQLSTEQLNQIETIITRQV